MQDLVGSYRLTKVLREILDTGEVIDMTGTEGAGYIMYGADGRMMVQINYDGRPRRDRVEDLSDDERLTLFKSMVAYGGTYSLDGDKIAHHVDISWNESWTGKTFVRELKREGDKLIYLAPAAPASDSGQLITTTLIWERVKP